MQTLGSRRRIGRSRCACGWPRSLIRSMRSRTRIPTTARTRAKGEQHLGGQRPVAQGYDIAGAANELEQRLRLVALEHERLADGLAIARPAHGSGRTYRQHVSGHEPIEPVLQRSEVHPVDAARHRRLLSRAPLQFRWTQLSFLRFVGGVSCVAVQRLPRCRGLRSLERFHAFSTAARNSGSRLFLRTSAMLSRVFMDHSSSRWFSGSIRSWSTRTISTRPDSTLR
jgi:hypothetical protein